MRCLFFVKNNKKIDVYKRQVVDSTDKIMRTIDFKPAE